MTRLFAALFAAGLAVGCGSSVDSVTGKALVPGDAQRVAFNECDSSYSVDVSTLVATATPALDCRTTVGITSAGAVSKADGEPRVVVAVLDSAFNPYHSYFYETRNQLLKSPIYPQGAGPSSVTPEILAAFGVDESHILTVTRTGKFTQDLKADENLWDGVNPGEIYWFRGSNVLAVSYATNAQPPLKPLPVKNAHGTGTSASVLFSNPDAVILFVEAHDTLGGKASHDFAFQHPLVDILTTSYGFGASGVFPPEANAFHSSFKGVVRLGKLHFSSGGNSPGLTPFRAGAGPWWSIGVSGVEEEDETEGRALLSGNFPDFVSDFTQSLPYCLDCEVGFSSVSGTSFSTPRSAGLASKVLLEARRALNHAGGIVPVGGVPMMATDGSHSISNWQIRRALEEAAHVPTAAEAGVGDLPINDAAPWAQIGWGDLSADPKKGVVAEALAVLGFGQRQRSKPSGFCDFQTKLIEERHLYWDNVSPIAEELDIVLGDDLGGEPAEPLDQDPFLYCGSSLPGP